MEYEYLDADVEIEAGDEIFDKDFDKWMKCKDYGSGQRTFHVGRYRRPVTNKDRSVYSANGVTITIENTTGIKHAAAFLGAIAMMLDGQSDS